MYIRERGDCKLWLGRRCCWRVRERVLLASSGESTVSRRACCRKSVLSVDCVVRGMCCQLSVLSVECIVSGVLSVEYVMSVRWGNPFQGVRHVGLVVGILFGWRRLPRCVVVVCHLFVWGSWISISISLLRPYTFFSRSPLVFKTLFENVCELQWVVLYFKILKEATSANGREHVVLGP